VTYSHYDRLTALDATFLAVEDANAHMHIGAVSLFDAGPLTGAGGSVDLDRVRRLIEAAIHYVPRYQQRLAYVPVFGSPVWVDDPHFNLNYHVRHVRLPAPGDERLLKRLAGRIMSQQLDRAKPLWELWVVEGVEGERVALISKAHHCMIDGVGTVELTGALMRATPEIEHALDLPRPWMTRPAPAPLDLFLGELRRRAGEPLGLLRQARRALADPRAMVRDLREATVAVGEALGAGLRPASPTPLNIDIGPHRRFDWLAMDLDAIKEVKNRLGGTVNDVVLSIASGALRRFLHGRGLRSEDLDFRAMIPVNVRSEAERERLGNQVAMIVARLPLEERDPRRRLQRMIEITREVKRSHQALGVRTLEQVADWSFAGLFTAFARLSTSTRPYNVVITNVPGPQFPTYFLGAQMREVYPLVPLNRNQALGIALFSYNRGMFWGFNADWDAIPDLHTLVTAVASELDALKRASATVEIAVAGDRAKAQAVSARTRRLARRAPGRRRA
jgi:diacylglycerol O-acyltransferase